MEIATLRKELKVQECDATKAERHWKAGYIKVGLLIEYGMV